MKLADMADAPRPRSGVACVFDRLYPLLDVDDRATLAAWFTDPTASESWVAQRLTEATGIQVNMQAVARHRRGICQNCATEGRVWHG